MTNHGNCAVDQLAIFAKAKFVTSAYRLAQLPADLGWEVAFSGRSNVGKSSVINALCRRRNLVRTSKTPGRTQAINVFEFAPDRRLIDLPGYGYAKAPDAVRKRWHQLVQDYVGARQSLQAMVIIMDIRHPLQTLDWKMLCWTQAQAIPGLVLLNKSDKLKRGRILAAQRLVQTKVAELDHELFKVIAVSASRGDGIAETHSLLGRWCA